MGKRMLVKKRVSPDNTPGVTGFVGSGSKPIPLKDSEVKGILKQMGIEEVKTKIPFEVGETVKVISGPFEDFVAVIQEINAEKARLKVLVSMFGRDIPMELDYFQVEKL